MPAATAGNVLSTMLRTLGPSPLPSRRPGVAGPAAMTTRAGADTDATIDLRKVPDTVPADQREAAQKALDKGLDAGVEPNVPLDVWVDDDAHVRRVEQQLEVAGQTIDVTIVLADFGAHEEITVPPKATDITDKLDD